MPNLDRTLNYKQVDKTTGSFGFLSVFKGKKPVSVKICKTTKHKKIDRLINLFTNPKSGHLLSNSNIFLNLHLSVSNLSLANIADSQAGCKLSEISNNSGAKMA